MNNFLVNSFFQKSFLEHFLHFTIRKKIRERIISPPFFNCLN
ncbi:MAG: hypothetical protein MRERV_6c079 [Mycoplasmataceae bacterium RV_VA103A]|nr:MAG: hypothetical protein MRERV_6c079 [Mycoplasmataceae bacterium RV_VA103A]